MADNSSQESIDWTSEDERDIALSTTFPVTIYANTNVASTFEHKEGSSSRKNPSEIVRYFMSMGFSEAMVINAIAEYGENNTEAIVDNLLSLKALSSSEEIEPNDPNSNPQSNLENDFSDFDSDFGDDFNEIPHEETKPNDPNSNPQRNLEGSISDFDIDFSDEDDTEKDDLEVILMDMGFSHEAASTAVKRCEKDTSVAELIDFIYAANLSKEADAEMDRSNFASSQLRNNKKRKLKKETFREKNKKPERKRNVKSDDEVLHLPNPMIGFGVPRESFRVVTRKLPQEAMGPPYFLYENVALTPKGVWNTIKSHLYEIEPEFVDSKFFCAAARKRGYIHNLPLFGRFAIHPCPPQTIFEALPGTREFWPPWDKRTQLNCILTCVGSAQLSDRIRSLVEDFHGDPPDYITKAVMVQCKKWNMIWTGKSKVAPLEPDEIELIMGYPEYHTRGATRMERYKGLGNSFQVDTVAYQLSVLKELYPDGINVLSLFSGIGGAEIALHKLGIPMKNVVSVEKSSVCRDILEAWWNRTNQTGNLIHLSDVQDATCDKLKKWNRAFGGFDLVIGGSPCNNLAGGNRSTRDGLQGEHSSLFFDYVRILNAVKSIMNGN